MRAPYCFLERLSAKQLTSRERAWLLTVALSENLATTSLKHGTPLRYALVVIPETWEVHLVRLVDQLIAYEEGQITQDQEIAFFEQLVETGTCWQLQGHYQRVAATLIEAGLIKPPERAKVK